MRKKRKNIIKIGLSYALFCGALATLNSAYGRYKKISSPKRFRSSLNKHDLVVAFFYIHEKKMPHADRSKVNEAQATFKSVSKIESYRYADVIFTSVNAAKERLADLVRDYGVGQPSANSPIVALFRGGNLVTTKKGFLSRKDIKAFVDSYFGKAIAQIQKDKDIKRKRRLERARIRAYNRSYWYPYYGYGFGYGYPYYGYGYGYRPYFGFGFGHRYGGHRGRHHR